MLQDTAVATGLQGIVEYHFSEHIGGLSRLPLQIFAKSLQNSNYKVTKKT